MIIPTALVAPFSQAVAKLMAPPAGMHFDFSRPAGEAALVAASSVSWRIFKNPVALFAGGVAAVILELAEPSVRAGVWDHSTFRKDAVTRLKRTGFAAMMTVYGPRSAAESMIARVVRMHERVRGVTAEGVPYRANDQELLDWVQATASFGFIEAYHRLVHPLSHEQRSQAFAEGAGAARLYGALGAPASGAEWERVLDARRPGLVPSETILEFLEIMRHAPILPPLLRPLQLLLIRAAVDLVPPDLREKLGLRSHGLSRLQRPLVRLLGRMADTLPVRTAPPALASVRMGLGSDYLYRRGAA